MRKKETADPDAASHLDCKVDAASNAAATITIAADEEQFWAIDELTWSYSGDPTGGKVTISWGGVVKREWDVTSAGPGQAVYEKPLHNNGAKNEALVVTLAPGGSGVTGKINVRYR